MCVWVCQGWWEVQFLSRSGANLQVLATRYGKVHQVNAAGLRPGWKCAEPGGGWEYTLGGVRRPFKEQESLIATKPAASKGARTSVDPAVAAARAAHVSNSPLGHGPR
jgi:hypothetical protein